MLFVLTVEAVGKTALAVDYIFDSEHGFLRNEITALLWAPSQVLILIRHLLAVPCQILLAHGFVILRTEVLQEE